MNYNKAYSSLLVFLLSACVTGCATNVSPRTISIQGEYWQKNVTTKVTNIDCDVLVGESKYKLNAPAQLEITPKKSDLLNIYCKKPGYTMLETSSRIQQPESLAMSKLHDVNCNATSITMIGIPFVGVPLALIFQEPALLLTSFVGGSLAFVWGSVESMPFPKGYGYRNESITVQMMPNELISNTDKPVVYNTKVPFKKLKSKPCPV